MQGGLEREGKRESKENKKEESQEKHNRSRKHIQHSKILFGLLKKYKKTKGKRKKIMKR